MSFGKGANVVIVATLMILGFVLSFQRTTEIEKIKVRGIILQKIMTILGEMHTRLKFCNNLMRIKCKRKDKVHQWNISQKYHNLGQDKCKILVIYLQKTE